MLLLILFFLLCSGGASADRVLNKTTFYSYLLEYTVLLNHNDFVIDARCPLGGLYNDSYCTRTFSPGCGGSGSGGILINGRCRKRTVPVWSGLDDVDICTLAGAGPDAYLNRNIWGAAKKNKSFLYCIDIVQRLSPSPNLAYALHVTSTPNAAAAIGGGVGGGVALCIFCGVLVGINRIRRVRNNEHPNINVQSAKHINAAVPIIIPKHNPIRIAELEYARHKFGPVQTRRPLRQ
jgi:hypothetical protein